MSITKNLKNKFSIFKKMSLNHYPFLGWPKILLEVWHCDQYGRQEIYGYGSVFLPTSPGEHEVFFPICKSEKHKKLNNLKPKITFSQTFENLTCSLLNPRKHFQEFHF